MAGDASSDDRASILVLSASGDTASQYMAYMNAFFSAQKMGVTIDSCMLERDSGLMQQVHDQLGARAMFISKVLA